MKLFFLLFCLIISLAESKESFTFLEKRDSPDFSFRWFQAENEESFRAVALLIHGLNTNPQKMESLAQILEHKKIKTLLVTLSGHGGSLENMKHVTRDIWLNNLFTAFQVAKDEAYRLDLPLYFVGFSLGAGLGVDLLTDHRFSNIAFNKMILIAPALSIKSTAYLLYGPGLFGPEIVIPSIFPRDYRVHYGTSLNAFMALFKTVQMLKDRDYKNADVPTLLVVDPKDELVSLKGIKNLIEEKKLQQWDMQIINNNESDLSPHYHHLMIDEKSLGTKNWILLKQRIENFLVSD